MEPAGLRVGAPSEMYGFPTVKKPAPLRKQIALMYAYFSLRRLIVFLLMIRVSAVYLDAAISNNIGLIIYNQLCLPIYIRNWKSDAAHVYSKL